MFSFWLQELIFYFCKQALGKLVEAWQGEIMLAIELQDEQLIGMCHSWMGNYVVCQVCINQRRGFYEQLKSYYKLNIIISFKTFKIGVFWKSTVTTPWKVKNQKILEVRSIGNKFQKKPKGLVQIFYKLLKNPCFQEG